MFFISFLGGLSAKLYDDMSDNKLLKKYYNKTFMEFLKGLHFITFTTISIYEPLFFISEFFANVLNHLANENAYKDHYEYSLLFSFVLLFFIIDYSKISCVGLMDIIFIIGLLCSLYVEPILMSYFNVNKEFSFEKMVVRSILTLGGILAYRLSTHNAVKCIFAYGIGYLLCSAIIQMYSINKKRKKIKKKN